MQVDLKLRWESCPVKRTTQSNEPTVDVMMGGGGVT
jgi:hypothetical protein